MSTSHQIQRDDILQNRFGLRVAARLSAGASDLPHELSERLRVARQQALERRRHPVVVAHRPVVSRAAAVMRQGPAAVLGLGGGDGPGFWGRASTAVLLAALAIGLVTINIVQDNDRAVDIADLDAALLTDDLPPQAYADPGFLQFLKTRHQERGTDSSADRPET